MTHIKYSWHAQLKNDISSLAAALYSGISNANDSWLSAVFLANITLNKSCKITCIIAVGHVICEYPNMDLRENREKKQQHEIK